VRKLSRACKSADSGPRAGSRTLPGPLRRTLPHPSYPSLRVRNSAPRYESDCLGLSRFGPSNPSLPPVTRLPICDSALVGIPHEAGPPRPHVVFPAKGDTRVGGRVPSGVARDPRRRLKPARPRPELRLLAKCEQSASEVRLPRDARLAVGGLRCPQAVRPTPTSTIRRSFCLAATVLRDGVLMRRKASTCGAVICVTDEGMKG
jgi:hypothetical protein